MSSATKHLPNNTAAGFLEFIFHTHKEDVSRPVDLVTLAVHALVLSQDLRLVGDMGQILPKHWSEADPVKLRYHRPVTNKKGEKVNIPPLEKDIVLVCLTETAPNIILSISNASRCVGHSLVIDEVLKIPACQIRNRTHYREAFKDTEELFIELESRFIHPLLSQSIGLLTTSSNLEQLPPSSNEVAEEYIDNQPPPPRSSQREQLPSVNPSNVYDYGRRDLDPFAAGPSFAGGMLFNPRFSGQPSGLGPRDPHTGLPLPQGAVPPGARFDPYMPGGVGTRPRRNFPDPDAPSPFGYDDMYM